MKLLHAVTRDIPDIPDESLVAMIAAIEPYIDYIQLREKSRSSKSWGLLIARLLENEIPVEKLIINERVDIAAAFGIPRTHLSEKSLSLARLQDALPQMKFGRSFHSLHAIERELAHYDYGYLGHVFPTSEKHYPALGQALLREAYQVSHRAMEIKNAGKLIAIGGINVDTLPKICPYIDGAAVMSALFPITNNHFDIERGRARAQALRNILADQST